MSEAHHVLRDLLVVFGVAVPAVTVLRRAGVPTVAGFLLSGVLIGRHGLALLPNQGHVEAMAEVGVVLLLFGIGLELSLERLRRLWQPILVGGMLQIGLTIGGTVAGAKLAGWGLGPAVFLGYLLTSSSTAIVLRGLEDRRELHSPQGRLAVGILVFQDLCVVPMMLSIPFLTGHGTAAEAVEAVLASAAIVVGAVAAAAVVIPRLLDQIAAQGERDVFLLGVLVACVGTAWLVSLAGLSLALGAFLAGLVVAGGRYHHQAAADLLPLRHVLSSLFFVSVGMLLDPVVLVQSPVRVAGLLGAVLVGKFLAVLATGLLMRLPLEVSVVTAAALAQVGEFAFVLVAAAEGTGLLEPAFQRELFAVAVLSMILTPVLIRLGPSLAVGAGRLRELTDRLGVVPARDAVPEEGELSGHVVVVGYGPVARQVCASLLRCGQHVVALELVAQRVRDGQAVGEPVFYGDGGRREILEVLGAARASQVLALGDDPEAVERVVRAAREVAPGAFLVARATSSEESGGLRAAGADAVIDAEVGVALEALDLVLGRAGVAPEVMVGERQRLLAAARGAGARPVADGPPGHR